MAETIILRFRDLITWPGETIHEHTSLLREFGEVWWGWWAKQTEIPPRPLFQKLSSIIQKNGSFVGYLFDSGTSKLYSTQVSRIFVAPVGEQITTPDPEKSPSYYHRAPCPAWFLLRSLKEVNFEELKFIYDSFPTLKELNEEEIKLIGQSVLSLEQMRKVDVTLWLVRTDE